MGKPEVRGLSRCFDAFGFALQSDFALKGTVLFKISENYGGS